MRRQWGDTGLRLNKSVFCLIAVVYLLIFYAGPCRADIDVNEHWSSLLDRKQADLHRMNAAVDRSAEILPARWPAVHKRLLILDAQLDRLVWGYYGSKESPLALQDLLINIERIKKKTEILIHPVRERLVALKQDEKLVAETLEEMNNQCRVVETVISGSLIERTRLYMKNLEKVGKKTAGLIALLESELGPANRLLKRMDNLEKSLKAGFDGILLHYFAEPMPHLFSLAGWKYTIEKYRQWYNQSYKNHSYLWADETSILYDALAASAIIIIIFSLLGRRLLGVIAERLNNSELVGHFFPFVFWVSVSLSVIVADWAVFLNRFSVISFLFAAALSAALISLSWNVRIIGGRITTEKKNPLPALWIVFSTGNGLMAVSFPSEASAPLWAVILLITSFYYRRKKTDGLPMFERRLLGVASLAIVIPALMSVLGWANLSFLFSSLIFVIVLSVHLTYGCVNIIAPNRDAANRDELTQERSGFLRLVFNYPLVFLIILYALISLAVTAAGGASLLHRLVDLKIGWDKLHFSLVKVPLIIALFCLTRSALAVTHQVMTRLPERFHDIDEGEILSLKIVSSYIFWTIFFMTALYALGFNLGHIAIIGGGLSVGVGFGMQNVINNFVSGIILLLGRSIKPGDLVEVEGLTGMIERVTIRNTLVRTSDGTSVFVPNSQLVSKQFVNWSHQDPKLRMQISIPVAYGNDPQTIIDIIMDVIKANETVLKEPGPSASLAEFESSHMEFKANFWVEDFTMMGVISQIRQDIESAFRDRGIDLPVKLPVEIKPLA